MQYIELVYDYMTIPESLGTKRKLSEVDLGSFDPLVRIMS